jgi:hypothetical protein
MEPVILPERRNPRFSRRNNKNDAARRLCSNETEEDTMTTLPPTITREITAPVNLCDSQGRLNPNAIGWSRHPLHTGNLRRRFLRKKRWDYWCVMSPELAFSVVIANIDYLTLGGLYLLEYETQRQAETGVILPFSRRVHLPETVGGDIRIGRRGLSIHLLETSGGVRIEATCPRLKGMPLSATLDIDRPRAHETLNVVIPWNETTFQFTSKQICLPATGSVVWGDREYQFQAGAAHAVLDYGRGIWPYRTIWNWAAFSGRSGADVVGVTMGAKWTDGTGANENGIYLNGRMHKLFEDIEFTYDTADFMRPWRMRTLKSDAMDLTFTPFHDKKQSVNLGIIRSKTHQCFGRYTGTVRPDGHTVAIDNLLGWAEEHHARW